MRALATCALAERGASLVSQEQRFVRSETHLGT